MIQQPCFIADEPEAREWLDHGDENLGVVAG